MVVVFLCGFLCLFFVRLCLVLFVGGWVCSFVYLFDCFLFSFVVVFLGIVFGFLRGWGFEGGGVVVFFGMFIFVLLFLFYFLQYYLRIQFVA